MCITPKVRRVFFTSAASSSASAAVIVIGFSHITLKPASRQAFAIGKWVKFGVQMATKSRRSAFGRAASVRTISCHVS